MNLYRRQTERRGAIVPLFAILLIPILAMLCFSIDAGWMVLTRTDLQSTADAAALAGAEKLQELYVQYNMPVQLSQATILATATGNTPGSPMATAEAFSVRNKAGNVYISLLDQDVHFGFGQFHSSLEKISRGSNGCPHSQPPMLVLCRARIFQLFLNVFYGD